MAATGVVAGLSYRQSAIAAISSMFSRPAAMMASAIVVGSLLRKRQENKTPSGSFSGRSALISCSSWEGRRSPRLAQSRRA
jgi:hypothetical protein